ncbi:hypothetical protein KRZ98_18370 [Sphingobium sp. AS12]|uniref:hypothetical protein n=1 Tax=Sphingobium sp. AS12 TaxID=2849495 RepID=UPI001C3127A8|nr:hypothetical protein [Sphingobium sp. AS12]MBV2150204.1 hypothetical protein [Sphingobium sp. AS12]
MREVSAIAIAAGTQNITNAEQGLEAIRRFQGDWKADSVKHSASQKALEAESRSKLYNRLGEAWEVMQELIKLSDHDQAELMAIHKLKPVKKGYNELAPFNAMLWGEWKAIKAEDENKDKWNNYATKHDNGTKFWFKVNRSAEKYAKVMRYAQYEQLTRSQLVSKLTSLKMDEVIASDTRVNSANDMELKNFAKYRAAVLAQPSHVTISRGESGIAKDYGNKFVALWGRINPKGDIEIMGQYPASVKAIDGHIDKLAKTTGKDALIVQLEKAKSASKQEIEAASAE